MSSPDVSFDGSHRIPHVALLPSAGMGHLMPFLRLAVALSGRGCDVSLIITHPSVSAAESRHIEEFISAFPQVRPLHISIPPLDPSEFTEDDPFSIQREAIRRSIMHLLQPFLTSSGTATAPPISALVIDIFVVSAFAPIAASLGFPCYVFFTSSAMMLSFCAYFSNHVAEKTTPADVGGIDVPGARRVPMASISIPLHDSNHFAAKRLARTSRAILKFSGILINTFAALEPDVLAAMNNGEVMPELPPVIAIGPLQPLLQSGASSALSWLDEQPDRSVVYVSLGSRTTMSPEQIKELGSGLERSGCRFLWVIKTAKVDSEDTTELEELLGASYLRRVEDRGLILKAWVEQVEILAHRAVGGFVSHCGWNSVTEAVMHGVKLLAWPRGGDQRINAELVARNGLGVWQEDWSWQWDPEVVKGEEIGERVMKMMADEVLRSSAARLAAEAATAVAAGGSSHEEFTRFISGLLHV